MSHVVIIGGGIAGLAAAYRLQQAAGAGLSYQLIEASPRFGGKIVTERVDGFTVEGGPDSVIAHKSWALDLMRELGLSDRLLPSNDDLGGVQVLRRGRLVPLPAGLQVLAPERWGEFLRSPLLSWPAKLRFALERWVPRRKDECDESVADFVRRRLGEEALWGLAEPVLAHVHAADIERMSLLATYPRLAELETRHGSLQRGAEAQRVRQEAGEGPQSPMYWTLEGGLAELVAALVERLDPGSLMPGRRVLSLRRSGDAGYTVCLDAGGDLAASAVLLATPAAAAAELVAELDPGLAGRLGTLRCASMATMSLGFRAADVAHTPGGFGFFVPRREQRSVLAGSWTSTKFDHRAPAGHALLRIFLGGAGGDTDAGGEEGRRWRRPAAPPVHDLDDEDLVRAVRADLRAIMGLVAEPVLAKLSRWPAAYPQYDVGHRSRLRDLEATLPPGLVVAGSAYHGVGLPDCVRSGQEAAQRVLDG